MKRDTLVGLALGVPAGLLIGYFVGAAHLFDSEAVTTAPVAAAPIPAAMGQLEAQQRIVAAEAAAAQNPKDVNAWVQLGNGCADLHLSQKAVDAYAKALALAPGRPENADILTDQGVMFRELKQFDKALADFRQASQLNPAHVQSLYNLGVVYMADLKQPDKAREIWTKYLQFDSTSPTAQQIKSDLSAMPPNMKANPQR